MSTRKPKVIKRDDRRELPRKSTRQWLLDRKAILMREVQEIDKRLREERA